MRELLFIYINIVLGNILHIMSVLMDVKKGKSTKNTKFFSKMFLFIFYF